jgi:molybdopterin molybdotransferase
MPSTPTQAGVLSFEEARSVVEEHVARLRPSGKELVELLEAAGQILAEPVVADRNYPPFPRATRDGYAIRAADLAKLPASLQVIGEIKAGSNDQDLKIESGEAVSIMTGAPAPAGADAVVMIEYTSRDGNQVEITRSVTAGENIVAAGAEAKRGDRLLSPALRLDHAAIGLAASVGRTRLLVYSRPRVAVLSTGDELVDIDVPPARHQIRNSNSYSLASQIQAAGGEAVLLPIAPDEPERLRELILEGFDADLLLITGGVSMGKYDLVEQVLTDLKAEFFFTGAKIQPGRPVVFGRVPWDEGDDSSRESFKYFFGLPGNPVSTMVTYDLFARPIQQALTGMAPQKLVWLHARLKAEMKAKTGLRRFLPAVLSGEFDQAEVEAVPWHGSGDMAATARANCYVVVPPDREQIPAGEWVGVLRR